MASLIPVHITYGALFVGNSVSCLVFGIVVSQVYKYFRRYPMDRPAYKLLVLLLMALETADQALIGHAVYFYTVVKFDQPLTLLLGDVTHSLILQITIGAIAGIVVKLCFAMRLWRFSDRNLYVTGLILLLIIAQLVLSIIYTVKAFLDPKFSSTTKLKIIGELSLGAGAVTDILTAAALCFFLRRFRTGHNRQSDSVVGTLMLYAVNTGVVTSGVSLATLITYHYRPGDMIFIGEYFVLSKLYAISFLATLNTRRSIRGRGTDRENTNTGHTGPGGVATITTHSATFYMLNNLSPQKELPYPHRAYAHVNPQESFFSADVAKDPSKFEAV